MVTKLISKFRMSRYATIKRPRTRVYALISVSIMSFMSFYVVFSRFIYTYHVTDKIIINIAKTQLLLREIGIIETGIRTSSDHLLYEHVFKSR